MIKTIAGIATLTKSAATRRQVAMIAMGCAQ
jgi:hypothetical protein